jgi:hypothetical protein
LCIRREVILAAYSVRFKVSPTSCHDLKFDKNILTCVETILCHSDSSLARRRKPREQQRTDIELDAMERQWPPSQLKLLLTLVSSYAKSLSSDVNHRTSIIAERCHSADFLHLLP